MRNCSESFSIPNQSQDVVESNGCKAMIALFNADQKDTLASIRYSMLCKKVARAKMFVTPERLPPTASACKFHSLRTYYQIMEWILWGNGAIWVGMEGRRGQTCSSDDRQKPCSRGTDSDDSLQLCGSMHYPTVYAQKAWTRVYQCVWTLPRRQLRQYEKWSSYRG